MVFLMIDSCAWLDCIRILDLMNGPKKLKKLLKENECKILLPSIVVDEFRRRVDEEISKRISSVEVFLSEVAKIASLCQENIDRSCLSQYFRKSIDEVLEEIESLFLNSELLSVEKLTLLDSLQHSIARAFAVRIHSKPLIRTIEFTHYKE